MFTKTHFLCVAALGIRRMVGWLAHYWKPSFIRRKPHFVVGSISRSLQLRSFRKTKQSSKERKREKKEKKRERKKREKREKEKEREREKGKNEQVLHATKREEKEWKKRMKKR